MNNLLNQNISKNTKKSQTKSKGEMKIKISKYLLMMIWKQKKEYFKIKEKSKLPKVQLLRQLHLIVPILRI